MPTQTTEYEGGQRKRLDEGQVVALARSYAFGVPVGFIVGMAKRESNWTVNQIDTDYDSEGNPRPNKTYGLLMINQKEALGALSLTAIDTDGLLDPATNIRVLCTITARHREALSLAAPNEYTEEDMLRYLCWAHNAGIGDCLPGVRKYGLDWAAFLQRNAGSDYVAGRLKRYTDEVISYVQRYPEAGQGSDDFLARLGLLLIAGWYGWKRFVR